MYLAFITQIPGGTQRNKRHGEIKNIGHSVRRALIFLIIHQLIHQLFYEKYKIHRL